MIDVGVGWYLKQLCAFKLTDFCKNTICCLMGESLFHVSMATTKQQVLLQLGSKCVQEAWNSPVLFWEFHRLPRQLR